MFTRRINLSIKSICHAELHCLLDKFQYQIPFPLFKPRSSFFLRPTGWMTLLHQIPCSSIKAAQHTEYKPTFRACSRYIQGQRVYLSAEGKTLLCSRALFSIGYKLLYKHWSIWIIKTLRLQKHTSYLFWVYVHKQACELIFLDAQGCTISFRAMD